MILVIDLSYPRKKLAEEIDLMILKAKTRGYSSKKIYDLVPFLLAMSAKSDSFSIENIKNNLSCDFIYSLVLPVLEVIRNRSDVSFFVKYTYYKLKSYHKL